MQDGCLWSAFTILCRTRLVVLWVVFGAAGAGARCDETRGAEHARQGVGGECQDHHQEHRINPTSKLEMGEEEGALPTALVLWMGRWVTTGLQLMDGWDGMMQWTSMQRVEHDTHHQTLKRPQEPTHPPLWSTARLPSQQVQQLRERWSAGRAGSCGASETRGDAGDITRFACCVRVEHPLLW